MIVNTKAMAGVIVVTRDGEVLGKVASFQMNADTGQMTSLLVHAPGLVPGLFRDELDVPWSAVLDLKPERVLVMDGLVKQSGRTRSQEMPSPLSSPTMMRDVE